eukprot:symbB.v1.2.009813.t1/scaffold627.1/size179893/5
MFTFYQIFNKGPGGAIINDIRQKAGSQVNISVLQANTPGGAQICRITGPEELLPPAEEMITAKVNELIESRGPRRGGRPVESEAEAISPFNPGQLYASGTVTVDVDGALIPVKIDPYYGPQPVRVGGQDPGPNDNLPLPVFADECALSGTHKKWSEYTITEQKLAVYQTARISKMRQEHAADLLYRLAWEKQLAALKAEISN